MVILSTHTWFYLNNDSTSGMYTVLFFLTVHQLWSKKGRFKKLPKLLAVLVMYCVGTLHSALFLWEIISSLIFIEGIAVYDNPPSSRYEYSKLALEVVNCLIGDFVVVWRAWTLGMTIGRSRYALCAPPLLLLIATGVSGAGMVVTSAGFDIISYWPNASLRKWTIVWAVLTIATNFVVTLVIICEAWMRARRLHQANGPVQGLMILCAESGLLYACTFAVLLVLFLVNSHGAFIMNHMIPQLAGIYPTVLVATDDLCKHILRPAATTDGRASRSSPEIKVKIAA
ncbi:hypothetical protein K488DRAFT_85584 [Vararia minispora EC-137]|uniref:Uncharacterized protein n=1 Tax=Vararia minispora EC-137 TaxID=1314806 RepID=A0ACB8QM99_9AGAM|nr:hypothetical protein K488DRAFT_85584 [Vararia minispora EC-137]